MKGGVSKDIPESTLRGIIRRAIEEGKLFELIFTENGRRLWKRWPEERVKEMVREELKKASRR